MTTEEIAEYLDTAAKNATAVEQIETIQSIDLKTAYTIQHQSIQRRIDRGETVTGYKLGFTSHAKMEQMGVNDLIWGILTDEMRIQPQAEVDLARWIHPRAEPEVAFRVGKTIDGPIALEDVSDYLDKMAPAIEVIDSRYKDFKFSLEDVVADNCSSTGYVIGKWHDLKSEISHLSIQLKINNETVQKGKTSAILNNPFQSVVELSRLASEAGLTVEKGHVIMAGAATAAVYLEPHQSVETILDDFGAVKFSIA